jgi:hypothetical protein
MQQHAIKKQISNARIWFKSITSNKKIAYTLMSTLKLKKRQHNTLQGLQWPWTFTNIILCESIQSADRIFLKNIEFHNRDRIKNGSYR